MTNCDHVAPFGAAMRMKGGSTAMGWLCRAECCGSDVPAVSESWG
eukprot:CAMPEP_0113994798 /NCGR_PEP_ID=MMETSP0328-20130328/10869_1 /TAXON_ID=39455 /ORGANISM="Alexandrium minutum" /LENGTH=44 /assembly_acc=CAM_ASM_000350